MKIAAVKTFFSGKFHYVKIETDEGLYGWGECTLPGQQLGVDGVIKHWSKYLIGQDPMQIRYLWQLLFRGAFWRGGPVSQSALSGIDVALWDIKGKALNTPIYNLLGGKCREKLMVYRLIFGNSIEEIVADGVKRKEQGYKVLRMCPHDLLEGGFYEPGVQVRKSIKAMEMLRSAVGDDTEIIMECHTRLSPARAIELCNGIAEYRPFFVEDPIRSDSPELFRLLRSKTSVPLGTGEKFGAKWDYKCVIGEDLIDYVRTDICNCGGISEMKEIAAYADAHYMEMVPHGVPNIGFIAAMHVDFATSNFICQEDWLTDNHSPWLDFDVTFKDGYLTMGDRPGLGVEVDEDALEPFLSADFPRWHRLDGTVQDW